MANIKMSARFCPNNPIYLNLQLCAVFWTIFTFLKKVTNFKPKDSCADCFEANFDHKV